MFFLLLPVLCWDTFPNLNFIEGRNLTNAKNDFKYRYTSKDRDSNSPLVGWASASVDRTTATGKELSEADMIMAFGVLPVNVPPFALVVYGTGKDAVEQSLPTVMAGLAAGKLGAQFKESAVGVSVQRIEEIDARGNTVKMHSLKYRSTTGGEGSNGKASYVLHEGPLTSGPTVAVSFITTVESGIITYGEAPVSPRSFEMVVEGKNFVLQAPENHLRAELVFFVGSGKDDVLDDAQVLRVNGTDVYAAVASHVLVDGKRVDAPVSSRSSCPYNMPPDDLFVKILGAAFDHAPSTRCVSVDFPVGATNFIYDPAVGAGTIVYKAAASTAVLSLLVVLVSALLALF